MGKKFDICIMNPPYDKNLHLKFLERIIQIADTVISVQPCGWLTNHIDKIKKNSDYNKYKETISEHIKDIEIINGEIARAYFYAQVNSIAIYICNKEGGYDYDKLTDTFPIKKILEKTPQTFADVNILNYDDKGIFVPLKLMTSEWDKNKDFIIDKLGILIDGNTKNGNYYKSERKRNKERPCGGIKFNTKTEAENFIDYTNTDFFVKYVNNVHTKTRYVLNQYPFLGNVKWEGKNGKIDGYKYKITDEILYEYFDLTNDEINSIKNYKI